MRNYEYGSIFAPYFKEFVKMKAANGFTTGNYEYLFKDLDLLFKKMPLTEPVITQEMVLEWRATRVNDSKATLSNKWSKLIQFTDYMRYKGFPCYVPIPMRFKSSFIPRIYTYEEIGKIFEEADKLAYRSCELPYNFRTGLFSIPALLRVLYATGMRVGESVSLNNEDVDFNKRIILIKRSKNKRQRIIPIGQSLEAVLRQYLRFRNDLPVKNIIAQKSPFFVLTDGSRMHIATVRDWFLEILHAVGIPYLGRHRGPRVHDLRHTFAVHSLAKLDKAGKDLYCALPILSVFMGHKTIDSTEKYVRLTQEMFPDISAKISTLSSYVFPKHDDTVNDDENNSENENENDNEEEQEQGQ